MSRLLYEKHVPADPLLAAAFAQMPPDQPQRLAGWLAGALGRPLSADGEDTRRAVGFTGDFGEQHRARWAILLSTAADEAMLPADPAFRSTFASCADWLSRAALTQGEAGPGAQQAPHRAGHGAPAGRRPPAPPPRLARRTRRSRRCPRLTSRWLRRPHQAAVPPT